MEDKRFRYQRTRNEWRKITILTDIGLKKYRNVKFNEWLKLTNNWKRTINEAFKLGKWWSVKNN